MYLRIRSGYLIMLLVFVLALYFTFIGLRYPYLGLSIEQTKAGVFVITKEPDSSAWTVGKVKIGDTVREVDGVSPEHNPLIIKTEHIDMADELLLERNGNLIRLKIPPFDSASTFSTHILAPFTIFLVLFLLSWRAYQSRKEDVDTRLLIAFSLSVGLSVLCAAASSRAELLSLIMVRPLLVSVPVFLLHFLFVFFAQRQKETYFPFITIRFGYTLVAGWLLFQSLFVLTNLLDQVSHNL
ncbi:hypothetical protein [Paenibacillus sp. SN-8-1]|uniref:hypothetical protein n=1 Tax=Paenibacillus sp. SN-8-1 TaxID=3435409 RepID=UPI003D9A287C